MGASSGLNVAAARDVAELMGPGHTIVTCLCDTGQVNLIHLQITYSDPQGLRVFVYDTWK